VHDLAACHPHFLLTAKFEDTVTNNGYDDAEVYDKATIASPVACEQGPQRLWHPRAGHQLTPSVHPLENSKMIVPVTKAQTPKEIRA
jgi:hypothetical protein